MPEITFGDDDDSGGSSGGGVGDIDQLIDQLERAEERIRNNPGLRKMLGIELDDLNMTQEPGGNGDSEGGSVSKDAVDAEYIQGVLESMCQQGYGDFTIQQVKDYVEQNPEELNRAL